MEQTSSSVRLSSTTKAVGRPRTIDESDAQQLVKFLKWGHTVATACRKSGIARSTYYAELARNEEFQDRVIAAQELLTAHATGVITRSIMSSNIQTAKWYLDRQDRLLFHAQQMSEYRITQKVVVTETYKHTKTNKSK